MNNEEKIQILQSNLARVQNKIEAAATIAGRSADDVTLVAVTKYVDAEMTSLIVDAGAGVLGENRPQVLDQKTTTLAGRDIEWHLIGHLQTNKVKKTILNAALIHSVDSLRLLAAIEKHGLDLGIRTRVLLEVNVSGDRNKHGIAPQELGAVLEHCRELTTVEIDGLMCMAGLGTNDQTTRAQFGRLRQLRDDHQHNDRGAHINLHALSMGMSGDFEMAIAEGATLVRVGSSLFEGLAI